MSLSAARNRSSDLKNDLENRIEYGKSRLWTGVSYLDDGLYGIAKDDLLLLGAYPGAGKTELANIISCNNVLCGKRVAMFALEAGNLEIEHRTLYRLFAKEYFADPNRPRMEISYSKWVYGELENLAVYDLKAKDVFNKTYKGLLTYYKTKNFTLEEFVVQISRVVEDGANLIIIDHAHYFDWGDRNENDGLKKVITLARDLNLLHEIPIILISHLRKPDLRNMFYAPSQEDFHGSSELYKRATKAITLGPGKYNPQTKMIDTYVNIVKNRVSGEVTRATGRMFFSFTKNEYAKEYEVGPSNQKRDSEFKTFNRDDVPGWCRSAVSSNDDKDVRDETRISVNQGGNSLTQSLPYKD